MFIYLLLAEVLEVGVVEVHEGVLEGSDQPEAQVFARAGHLRAGKTIYLFICFIFIDMRRVIYNISQKIEGIHENDF